MQRLSVLVMLVVAGASRCLAIDYVWGNTGGDTIIHHKPARPPNYLWGGAATFSGYRPVPLPSNRRRHLPLNHPGDAPTQCGKILYGPHWLNPPNGPPTKRPSTSQMDIIAEYEYPSYLQVLVVSGTRSRRCAGALLNSQYALTHSKCFRTYRDPVMQVRVYSSVQQIGRRSEGYVEVQVAWRLASGVGELVLLRLAEKLAFNETLQPACVSDISDEIDKMRLQVVGIYDYLPTRPTDPSRYRGVGALPVIILESETTTLPSYFAAHINIVSLKGIPRSHFCNVAPGLPLYAMKRGFQTLIGLYSPPKDGCGYQPSDLTHELGFIRVSSYYSQIKGMLAYLTRKPEPELDEDGFHWPTSEERFHFQQLWRPFTDQDLDRL